MRRAFLFCGVALSGFLFSCAPKIDLLQTRPGPEDLTLSRSGGSPVLYTGTAHRQITKVKENQGAIERHFIEGKCSEFEVIWEANPHDGLGVSSFHPVGIHSTVDPNKETTLHVAGNSMGNRGLIVEILVDHHGKAKLNRHTCPSELPGNVNGITVTEQGQVYFSTFSAIPKPFLSLVKRSDVVNNSTNSIYLVSKNLLRIERVAHSIHGANGLALTDDGKFLLVCAYHDRSVLAYRRDIGSGKLHEKASIIRNGLPFFPDNLKALGGNRFSIAGQRSRLAVALNFLMGWPTAGGGAEVFSWSGKGDARQIADLSAIIKNDGYAPSTVIPFQDRVYTGHIVGRGVGRFKIDNSLQ